MIEAVEERDRTGGCMPQIGDALCNLTTAYPVNPLVCCATHEMSGAGDSTHVRNAEFHLPRFAQAPTVSVQVTALPGSSVLVVYSVKINDNIGHTQIAIEAQTVPGGPAEGTHYCTIIATGMPLLHIQPSSTRHE